MKCPTCRTEGAYIGFSTIECCNPSCSHYIPNAVSNTGIGPPQVSWSSDSGQDQLGHFADLTVRSVVQRLRWIPPGKFLMGSPDTEPERFENEVLHEVELTRGYWLADTACTQELYEAVRGCNPSIFKGKELPVEMVTWYDSMGFLTTLNYMVSNLNADLPTEARWEYACRAGTSTPFSFGNNISTDKANYNGNWPYNNGTKGIYREETIEVKDLGPNQWGLYQMHGNVGEWCKDWYGDYPNGPIKDPLGPNRGMCRVLRGGSWFSFARYCRSDYRCYSDPVYRDYGSGFRFVVGGSSRTP
jgi:formylglycine-generating enzyme required for sulfatase activity